MPRRPVFPRGPFGWPLLFLLGRAHNPLGPTAGRGSWAQALAIGRKPPGRAAHMCPAQLLGLLALTLLPILRSLCPGPGVQLGEVEKGQLVTLMPLASFSPPPLGPSCISLSERWRCVRGFIAEEETGVPRQLHCAPQQNQFLSLGDPSMAGPSPSSTWDWRDVRSMPHCLPLLLGVPPPVLNRAPVTERLGFKADSKCCAPSTCPSRTRRPVCAHHGPCRHLPTPPPQP